MLGPQIQGKGRLAACSPREGHHLQTKLRDHPPAEPRKVTEAPGHAEISDDSFPVHERLPQHTFPASVPVPTGGKVFRKKTTQIVEGSSPSLNAQHTSFTSNGVLEL